MHILIVENTPFDQKALYQTITRFGFNATAVDNGPKAMDLLKNSNRLFHAVIMNMILPDTDARQMIQAIKTHTPRTQIVVLTRDNMIEHAHDALRWGAHDFLTKPLCRLRLGCILQHVLAQIAPPLNHISHNQEIVPNAFFNGNEAIYTDIKSRFHRAFSTGIPILIEGARSTGKTKLAQHFLQEFPHAAVHIVSFDAQKTQSETLHDTVATMINEAKTGNLIACLLIQRIELASAELQAALKDIVEEHVIQNGTIKMVATTTGRLMDAVQKKNFLAVLYSRLQAMTFWMAPLYERNHDIKILSQHFLQQANSLFATRFVGFMPETMNNLSQQFFPENIRSLRQHVFKMVLDHSDPKDTPPFQMLLNNPELSTQAVFMPKPPPATPFYGHTPLFNQNGRLRPLQELEAEAIRFAHQHHHGHMQKIAKELGIGRTTLYRKLLRYNLNADTSQLMDLVTTPKINQTEPISHDRQNHLMAM